MVDSTTSNSSACPYPIDLALRDRLANGSSSVFNSTGDLDSYVCEYTAYIAFRETVSGACEYGFLVFRILGLTSSLLTLATMCSNGDFSGHCFVYYKAIAILELAYNLSTGEQALEGIYAREFTHNYHWFLIGCLINNNIGNMFPHCTDSLTIFLSIERAIACLLPARFYVIQNRTTCVGVFVVAISTALITYVPPVFSRFVGLNPSTGTYFQYLTDVGKSWQYGVYDQVTSSLVLVQSISLIVCTGFAIAGMIRAIMLKRRLFSTVTPIGKSISDSSKLNAEAIGQNIRMCFLQASLAVPICMNKVAYYVAMKYRSVLGENGTIDFYKAYRFEYLSLITAATDILAYSGHFYLYVIFSRTFREAFGRRFLGK